MYYVIIENMNSERGAVSVFYCCMTGFHELSGCALDWRLLREKHFQAYLAWQNLVLCGYRAEVSVALLALLAVGWRPFLSFERPPAFLGSGTPHHQS